MPLRTTTAGRLARWMPAFVLVTLFLAGCASKDFPQTTLDPRGDFARLADDLFMTTVKWATVVFVLVEAALLVAIWKFRARPGAPEPEQTHGNTKLEIVWTVIPAFILAMIAVPTVRTIFQTAQVPGPDAVQVEVIGHQWWWEFRYPQYNIITANELIVPEGRTVNLELTTNDVLHSFWVPQFAAKRDVFPGRHNNLWFKAEVTGNFPGQCAEFCGQQHGRMAHRIIVKPAAEFDQWAASFNDPAPNFEAAGGKDTTKAASAAPAPAGDSLAAKGQQLFAQKGCIGCHSIQVPAIPGLTGPNLHHIGSRTWIAAGTLENTDENLARWLRDPQAWKKGVLMPNLGLKDDEITALVAYLRANK